MQSSPRLDSHGPGALQDFDRLDAQRHSRPHAPATATAAPAAPAAPPVPPRAPAAAAAGAPRDETDELADALTDEFLRGLDDMENSAEVRQLTQQLMAALGMAGKGAEPAAATSSAVAAAKSTTTAPAPTATADARQRTGPDSAAASAAAPTAASAAAPTAATAAAARDAPNSTAGGSGKAAPPSSAGAKDKDKDGSTQREMAAAMNAMLQELEQAAQRSSGGGADAGSQGLDVSSLLENLLQSSAEEGDGPSLLGAFRRRSGQTDADDAGNGPEEDDADEGQ